METVDELMNLAEEQGSDDLALGFLERAVRLADGQNDRAAGFRARTELIRAATFSGYPDRAMIHFAWVIGAFDRYPGEFADEAEYVMWMYKWILSGSLDNPDFPLDRLTKLHADFERRAQVLGEGAHYAAYHRLNVAAHTGDLAEAQRAFLAWRATPRDDLSDCAACEQNKLVTYYADRGNLEAAVKLGQEIIQKGMNCHDVPTVTHANLLMPLLRLGRTEDARAAHDEGLRLARLDPNFIDTMADHTEYLVAVGEHARALEVWSEHLHLALEVRNPLDQLSFLMSSAQLWQALESAEQVRVRLPRTFALFRPDHTYAAPALAAHFRQEAAALAGRFDRRNGTSAFTDQLRTRLDTGEGRPRNA